MQKVGALISLEWRRDADGYDLLPEIHSPPKPEEVCRSLLAEAMAWLPLRVVGRGGRAISCWPLEADKLFARFAGLHTPEDVLGFIHSWGPLTELGHDPVRGEDVAPVLEHAAAFRALLNYEGQERQLASWIGSEGKMIARLDLSLVMDRSGMPRLRLRPKTLLEGLWLQLGQKLSGDRPWRECLHCGTWFETGPGAGRRLDAVFCSDDHRTLFNSRKRSQSPRRRENA
jgi:hypothetical protein